MLETCVTLLMNPDVDTAVRAGDVYA